MKSYRINLGLITSTFITLGVLPVRIFEGQTNNLYNLIGSQIIIWVMCLTAWLITGRIQKKHNLLIWQKIIFSVLACAGISILFYYLSNPFFEDFPLNSMSEQSLSFAILRLSFRGFLLGSIVVPILFYLENIRTLQKVKQQNELRRWQDIENHNHQLEKAVRERTQELEQALLSLEITQKELSEQLKLQIRMTASISHDINTPFHFAIMIIKKMNDDIRKNQFMELPQFGHELENALVTMHQFLTNILTFSKTQFKSSNINMETIRLSDMVEEKARIFQGVITLKGKDFFIDVDTSLHIETNRVLFSVILHNLIDNAIKHSSSGLIKIQNRPSGSNQHLIVENTGNAIPERVISWVNGNEQQNTDNPLASRMEHGIGLILVKEIAEMLHIKVFIETVGETTKFHLILPVQEDARVQALVANRSALPAASMLQ